MMFLVIACYVLVSSIQASYIPLGSPVVLSPDYHHRIRSLYHAQDNLGQYAYGYSTPTSSKSEIKTANGVTQGGYSYLDSNGILQTVEYTADPIHGFRVAASNLPQDNPDVAAAKERHLIEYQAIKANNANIVKYSNPIAVPLLPQPVQDLPEVVKAREEHLAAVAAARAGFIPVAVQDLPEVAKARAEHLALVQARTGLIPQPVQDLPEVVKARAEHFAAVEATKQRDAAVFHNAAAFSPVNVDLSSSVAPIRTALVNHGAIATLPRAAVLSYAPISYLGSSQYHQQNGFGQYSYGYVGPLGSKSEIKSADGVTRGGYSYIDANGILQSVSYTADAVHGFRVAASNLPVNHY